MTAIIIGAVGLYKIYQELRRLDEQRSKDIQDKDTAARLKRTEFFLTQHRRLFDDKDLFEVLCLIDSDHPELADISIWDKKRKLMAFFEEIALLVKSKQINEDVAFYMFGYYTLCARYGKNFNEGIDISKEYWALFFEFSEKAEKYLEENKDGPPHNMSL
ncbi:MULTISPECIES: hypothetical protein [Pseudomonas]|uniref:hypothetical protein n=1 Tax=Pseudomonas TaxID=286 RepID=UPI002114BE0D|nr:MULTISPECIES: hypothetical protein [Pseudomonas]WDG51469.1 hypothetical protein PUP76_16375 [Pseudomonas chlororaphis]WDH87515.1 hypothetical protein PUP74_25810 [Pseudomonas chlororaphis]